MGARRKKERESERGWGGKAREKHSKVVKKGRHYGSYFRSEDEKNLFAVLNRIWSPKLKSSG